MNGNTIVTCTCYSPYLLSACPLVCFIAFLLFALSRLKQTLNLVPVDALKLMEVDSKALGNDECIFLLFCLGILLTKGINGVNGCIVMMYNYDCSK